VGIYTTGDIYSGSGREIKLELILWCLIAKIGNLCTKCTEVILTLVRLFIFTTLRVILHQKLLFFFLNLPVLSVSFNSKINRRRCGCYSYVSISKFNAKGCKLLLSIQFNSYFEQRRTIYSVTKKEDKKDSVLWKSNLLIRDWQ
jgi:hypothetical protein